ncbi:MAG TPA: alkylhydroperoxidase-related (seleno)protein [Candidatus Dormibacteraeota bacterium]
MPLITSSLPQRPDLVAAVDAAWPHIAMPGATWTGTERVAIAGEARAAQVCQLCADRKTALSPYHVPGEHATMTPLPLPAVDAVHRIVTDPARLTERWLRSTVDSGLSEPQYVELVAVVATLVAVDTLALALGVPPPELPSPAHGRPSGHVAREAVVHSAWVPTVSPDAARGELAELYRDRLTNRWGFVGNVNRALTLVPEEQLMMCSLLEAMYGPMAQMGGGVALRALAPAQIELVAATVSAVNGCFY